MWIVAAGVVIGGLILAALHYGMALIMGARKGGTGALAAGFFLLAIGVGGAAWVILLTIESQPVVHEYVK